jgi:cytochrome c553
VTQQLLNFKSGERDNDDRGVMRAVAKRMSEAQMRSVAQYIATLQEGEK